MSNDDDIVVVGSLLREEDRSIISGGGGGSFGGTPPERYYDSAFIDSDYHSGVNEPGDTSGAYQPAPMVSVEGGEPDPNDPKTYPDRQALQFFRQSISEAHTKMSTADASISIVSKDGKTVTLDEFYSNNLHLNFNITFNVDYPPGFGGQTGKTKDGDGWISKIDHETVQNYSYNPNGTNMLAMHELAHTTNAASDYLALRFGQWYRLPDDAKPEWGKSDQFKDVENYTNNLAYQMAKAIDLPIWENPPLGI